MDGGSEWPEFRPWHELLLEEEQLVDQEDSDERGEKEAEIWKRSEPLETAMLSRQPRTPQQAVILSLMALREADRKGAIAVDRLLVLGDQSELTSEYSMERMRAASIDAFLRLAISMKWVPAGVKIYGEGGNA
jgi:hypothetical protein